MEVQYLFSHIKKHRAVSEALGALPLKITGPDTGKTDVNDIQEVTFETVLFHCKNPDINTIKWHGRTLTLKINSGQIACIKFARSKENASQLIREALWLSYLRQNPPCHHSKFKIPVPVRIHDKSFFRLTRLPDWVLKNRDLSDEYLAIVFLAKKEYFLYANEPGYFNDQNDTVKKNFAKTLGCLEN
ncbi:MAG: hypothetical protein GXP56_02500 [Deltaproteobacteria bacterium]|nr:hypothetical protein [Deltaproteobacteria bacterium]